MARPPGMAGCVMLLVSDDCQSKGDVVQLVRTPACHVGGRGFEPRRPRHSLQTLTRFQWISMRGTFGLFSPVLQ